MSDGKLSCISAFRVLIFHIILGKALGKAEKPFPKLAEGSIDEMKLR